MHKTTPPHPSHRQRHHHHRHRTQNKQQNKNATQKVSHHIHTNDAALDEDVNSTYPALRFDARLPQLWFHRWQHLYMWLVYPAMHSAFQLGDLTSLFTKRTVGAEMIGASPLGARARVAAALFLRGCGWPVCLRSAACLEGRAGRCRLPAACSLLPNTTYTSNGKPLPQQPQQQTTIITNNTTERATILLGKALHYSLLLLLPIAARGGAAAPALLGAAGYSTSLSIVLAMVFFVSHNVPESKPNGDGSATTDGKGGGKGAGVYEGKSAAVGAALAPPPAERDWGVQQVLASCSWGGALGNFFTGGLNLQIEHHLFPAISFVHYEKIARVVRSECAARGVRYAHFPSLAANLQSFVACMRALGAAPTVVDSGGKGGSGGGKGGADAVAFVTAGGGAGRGGRAGGARAKAA